MSSGSTCREVVLHVYDVTKTVRKINRFFKDGVGVGGIFHSAVQVYGEEEWSFGLTYGGTGVSCCPVRQNPEYTFRESIVLGVTSFSNSEVNQILIQLSHEWPGSSYDPLSRNCNHFTNAFCQKLGALKIPGWVNRFANAGYTVKAVAETTALQFRQVKSDIAKASRAACEYMTGSGKNNKLKRNPQLLIRTEAALGGRAIGSRTLSQQVRIFHRRTFHERQGMIPRCMAKMTEKCQNGCRL